LLILSKNFPIKISSKIPPLSSACLFFLKLPLLASLPSCISCFHAFLLNDSAQAKAVIMIKPDWLGKSTLDTAIRRLWHNPYCAAMKSARFSRVHFPSGPFSKMKLNIRLEVRIIPFGTSFELMIASS